MVVVAAALSGGDSDPVASPAAEAFATQGSPRTVAAKERQEPSGPTAKRFNASGLLGGNASPRFPKGDRGEVSVVAKTALKINDDSGKLLIAYRNNTRAAISHVDINATASAEGEVVATGSSQGGAIPAQVLPGEVALNYVYFENVKSVPRTGVTFRFTAETMPADTSSYNTAPLKITQATNNGGAIIGTADNETGKKLTGPYGVTAYCFRGNKLSTTVDSFAEPDGDLAPDGQTSFTIDLYGASCDTFAIGASGYFD